MTILNLQIDSGVAERAESVARQRRITLDTLVEEYLEQLGRSASESCAAETQNLQATLRELSRPMGGKPWEHRDQLHER